MSAASPGPAAAIRKRPGMHVAALAAALLAYGSFALAPDAVAGWYVPLNVAAAGALLLLARGLGLSRARLGLERWREGARWGLGGAAVVAALLAVGLAIPDTRSLFDDARLAGVGTSGFLYRGLVRIPFGTALFEEVAFRGVLFGLWWRHGGAVAAAVGSSLVFGLWHVRPTIELLAANDLATQPLTRVLAMTGAVLATTVGGLFFCLLRVRSGSLAATFLVHTGINSLAIGAAWLAATAG